MSDIRLSFGDVQDKNISTENHFISHMIEHIAWRLGCSIKLVWEGDNWQELGKLLGSQIATFPRLQDSVAALGMIDDGSAEVTITSIHAGGQAGAVLSANPNIDPEWFMGLRCEQVENGYLLFDLLTGIAKGLHADIEVLVGNIEDQHHTWEGIFRGVGTALNKMYAPPVEEGAFADPKVEVDVCSGELSVFSRSILSSTVQRGTAETGITVSVDFSQSQRKNSYKFAVDDSIQDRVLSFSRLLDIFSAELQCSLSVDFNAKALSSSHVVCEDVGMVLGRALLEILKLRMQETGVNCAGSNVRTSKDYEELPVVVGVSTEGRKFWRFVPFDRDFQELQRTLLLGQTIANGVFSEDLDDFFDGLSHGMTSSIMVHVKRIVFINGCEDPTSTWEEIFRSLGIALNEVFIANPHRKGVPAGVKATLT